MFWNGAKPNSNNIMTILGKKAKNQHFDLQMWPNFVAVSKHAILPESQKCTIFPPMWLQNTKIKFEFSLKIIELFFEIGFTKKTEG